MFHDDYDDDPDGMYDRDDDGPATTPDGHPYPTVKLIGGSGNAFAILGAVTKALKRAGASPDYVKAFQAEATSGDYDHLLATAMKYADVN